MFKARLKIKKTDRTSEMTFDPALLDDPIAIQTEWVPAKSGGTNIATHKLVEVHPERLEFRVSMGACLAYLAIFLVGVGLIVYAFQGKYSGSSPIFPGLVFCAVGGLLMYYGMVPIVFDKNADYFWKGRKNPADQLLGNKSVKIAAMLENIHAIQLLSEYCNKGKTRFYSYEINLVLKDGDRINVVDHGNLKKVKRDAQKLSTFLGKPLWDMS